MSGFLDEFAALAARRAGPVAKLERDLRRLHEGFTGHRGGRAPDYFRSAGQRRAYLASLALPNAARALHVLGSAGAGLKAGERGLDAGAGTGASALALAALSHPDSEIVLVDRSGPALAEAARFFAELFPDGPRVATERVELGPRERGLPSGPFATVMAGHLLNELHPPRGRDPGPALAVAKALAGRVGGDGRLVFLEPAQRIPSRALCRVREVLLRAGWRPLGPCTHANACPVLHPRARDWCVVDVPFDRPGLVAAVDRLLGLDRTRPTVSYLALGRSEKAVTVTGVSFEVLSRPMRAGPRTIVYLCGARGRAALDVTGRNAPPRGSRIDLPPGAKPKGRDRSGAPLF